MSENARIFSKATHSMIRSVRDRNLDDQHTFYVNLIIYGEHTWYTFWKSVSAYLTTLPTLKGAYLDESENLEIYFHKKKEITWHYRDF